MAGSFGERPHIDHSSFPGGLLAVASPRLPPYTTATATRSRHAPVDPRHRPVNRGAEHLAATGRRAVVRSPRGTLAAMSEARCCSELHSCCCAWLLGVLGVYRVGDVVHLLLLVGLMLLLIAFLKAREAATRRAGDPLDNHDPHSFEARQLHPRQLAAAARGNSRRGCVGEPRPRELRHVAHPLHFWVNDVGMVFFFALAAKEVFEATLPGGPLASPRRAFVAARGGGRRHGGASADLRGAGVDSRARRTGSRMGDSLCDRHRVLGDGRPR